MNSPASAGISPPTHVTVTVTLALVTLLLVLPFTRRIRRRARRAGLIRGTCRQLGSIDVCYRPSHAEVAAMSGASLAEVRAKLSTPTPPPSGRRRRALVATLVARRGTRPRTRLLFEAIAGPTVPAA